jgi:pimeloyl-ACP methyl ester carboxylesterase
MIHWVTETAVSSARLYYESRQRPLSLSRSNRVESPVAVAVFPKEIAMPPKALAERGLNITHWTVIPKGGHFAAMEQPELLSKNLRSFSVHCDSSEAFRRSELGSLQVGTTQDRRYAP